MPRQQRPVTRILASVLASMAVIALSACQGGPSGSSASDEWTTVSESEARIQVRLPQITGAGER